MHIGVTSAFTSLLHRFKTSLIFGDSVSYIVSSRILSAWPRGPCSEANAIHCPPLLQAGRKWQENENFDESFRYILEHLGTLE